LPLLIRLGLIDHLLSSAAGSAAGSSCGSTGASTGSSARGGSSASELTAGGATGACSWRLGFACEGRVDYATVAFVSAPV